MKKKARMRKKRMMTMKRTNNSNRVYVTIIMYISSLEINVTLLCVSI